ncbi:hypothetical protein Ocin01_10808 [Orchesella cincta]|uniref:O-acyltransferase WSD1 C-terminal domain-containing protein n=1 Tax=Orchesella cincta TaxID=48709 RepID=A0A1D2MS53_ORCCI|nr:hypothetical protein Ocin01_10808 [Orchesella cincta]
MVTSPKSYMLRHGTYLVGTIFHFLSKYWMKNRICSTIITNIAGEEEGFNIEGKKCVDFSLTTGGNDYVGLTFCIMSFKGAFRICAVADHTVMPQEKVDKLSYLMHDEFHSMKYDIFETSADVKRVPHILEV